VTERLPLFPLATVLYPGLLLPLHIFEERYRLLVRRLVQQPEGAPRRFGVVAIRAGRETGAHGVRALYDVGCTAELRQVEAYEDGRFDIVTAGAERFRLLGVDQSQPYAQADVEYLPETGGTEAHVLAVGVGRLFARYQRHLGRGRGVAATSAGSPELPDDPGLLSYLVAAAMVLDLRDKQGLLEAPEAAARLARELRLLRREAALLRRLPSLPAVELTRAPASPN
jgi:uncharacterized protein